MKRVVYIIGPYTADTEAGIMSNINQARNAAEYLWSQGVIAICPHLNTSLMHGIAPYEVFVEGLCELLKRSDIGFALPGWQQSQGSLIEMERAYNSYGIPITTDIDLAVAFAQGKTIELPVYREVQTVLCPATQTDRQVELYYRQQPKGASK